MTTQPLLEMGYIDVTKQPYNADPTGQADSRAAIQRAADDAYANNLVTFVPKGTYLLSGAIRSIQGRVESTGTRSQRKFARTLVGDNSGGTAPVLKLMDNATDLPENIFLYFAFEGDFYPDARHYASLLRGFTIDMGNNPTASAVSMSAAQWATIQDLDIVGNFDAGITGLPGSGGSTTNIHIKGGKVGIRQNAYRPTPSVHAVTLENQRNAGIELIDSRGALVVVGFDIKGGGAGYQAVSITKKTTLKRPQRNLVMVDGKIELSAGAQLAIEGRGQDIYLRNSYVKAPTLIRNGNSGAAAAILAGDADQWLHVNDYLMASVEGGAVAFAGGEVIANGNSSPVAWGAPPMPVAAPPSLVDIHRWDAPDFPTIFNSQVIDVRDYGATPSRDTDDDSAAINAALRDSVTSGHRNFGKPVFLPRGHFHVRAPIDVPLNAVLLGASNTISVIDASTSWRPGARTALVRTADGVGPVTIANLAISGHEPSARAGLTAHKNIVLFHGRSSNMLLRDVQIARREYWKNGRGHFDQPVALFSDNAGGRVFNLGLDHWHGPAEQMAAGHRMIMIDGTSHPLHIYQPDVEGTDNSPQAEIRDSSNVYFYAFKYEGHSELLHIVNSENIEVLGGSGNYDLKEGLKSLIDIENSNNVIIANMARQGPDGNYAWLTNGDLTLDANRRNLALYRSNSEPLPEPEEEPEEEPGEEVDEEVEADPSASSVAVQDFQPLFTFPAVPNARRYMIAVRNTAGSLVWEVDRWHTKFNCSGEICTYQDQWLTLDEGAFTWQYRAGTSAGDQPWSAGPDFTINSDGNTSSSEGGSASGDGGSGSNDDQGSSDGGSTGVGSGPVTAKSPIGTINDNTPTFVWSSDNVDRYYLRAVDSDGNTMFIEKLSPSAAKCVSDSLCEYTGTNLNAGAYRWWVRGVYDGEKGPDSKVSFEIQ